MGRMFIRGFMIFLGAIALIGTTAVAQQGQPDPVEVVQRAAGTFVNKVNFLNSVRTSEFNDHISGINLLRPLDYNHLDSAHIEDSKQKIKAFLDFLGQYRDSSEMVLHSLEDSISLYRSQMPRLYQETFMSKYLTAYTADVNAFNAYTLTISELDKQVFSILNFIEVAKPELQQKSLQFKDSANYAKYMDMMKDLQKRNTDASSASAQPQQTFKDLQDAIKTLFSTPEE